MFKKTSADFDEGGAKGLLLNHLSTSGGLKVIFDSGDVVGGQEDKEDDAMNDDDDDMEQADDLIDSEKLQSLCFPVSFLELSRL